jgi:hypothetical protein
MQPRSLAFAPGSGSVGARLAGLRHLVAAGDAASVVKSGLAAGARDLLPA